MEPCAFSIVETSRAGGERVLHPLPDQVMTAPDPQAFANKMLAKRTDPQARTDPMPARIVVRVWLSLASADAGDAPAAVAEWHAPM